MMQGIDELGTGALIWIATSRIDVKGSTEYVPRNQYPKAVSLSAWTCAVKWIWHLHSRSTDRLNHRGYTSREYFLT